MNEDQIPQLIAAAAVSNLCRQQRANHVSTAFNSEVQASKLGELNAIRPRRVIQTMVGCK
jgi:hypothetical protein